MKHHKNDVYVEAGREIQVWDINTLKNFDVIHFHRHFGYYESAPELFPMLQQHGVKLVLDIDDFWEVPEDYPFAEALKDYKEMVDIMPLVDAVTTTTDILANKIREYNENVFVIPNGIDTEDDLWNLGEKKRDIIHVGWLGSRRRYHDLVVIKEAIERLQADDEVKGKFKFVLCGGDEEEISLFDGPNFMHVPGTDATAYPVLYENVDICLAPLAENEFNTCRSELKLVEAGVKKKAFVGQDFGIYSQHIRHNVNGLLAKTSDDWYNHIKNLILNPDEIKRLGNSLHNYVIPRFTMKATSQERVNLYKFLTNGKTE
jgi:glycosyltransferase involved in cell wall biosynthesis